MNLEASNPVTKAIQNVDIARKWLRDDVRITPGDAERISVAIAGLVRQIAKVTK